MNIINKIGDRMKRTKENYSFSNMDCNHENILTRLKMCWFYHFLFEFEFNGSRRKDEIICITN